MKAQHEFRNIEDFYKYMYQYISIQAMQGILFQNMMFAESDEVVEKNDPHRVAELSSEYAEKIIHIFKNKFEKK
jgi:hypothetical protein